MPQIWPMNWLLLFILFTSIFLVYLSFLYFNIKYTRPSRTFKMEISAPNLNWKW